MKPKIITTLFSMLLLLFAPQAFACPGPGAIRHVNPDGSQGGFKDLSAKVEATVTLGPHAKVCGNSWVSGEAKILDRAVIDGKFWIKGDVQISDDALVRGSGRIETISGKLIEIKDKAKITGSVNIFDGTIVHGRAELAGYGKFTNTTVGASAKVCDSYDYKNQNIVDGIFCSYAVEKTTNIGLANYETTKLNSKDKNLIITPARGNFFSLLPDATKIIVNGEILTTGIDVRRGYISVSKDQLREGRNEVYVRTLDDQKLVVQSVSVHFYASSIMRQYEITNLSSELRHRDAYYQLDNEKIAADTRVVGSTIFVRDLPADDFNPAELNLTLISASQFFSETLHASSATAEIRLIDIPESRNNEISFSEGMHEWGVTPGASYELVAGDNPRLKVTIPPGKSISFVRKVTSQELSKGASINPRLSSDENESSQGVEARVSFGIASIKENSIAVASEHFSVSEELAKRVFLLNSKHGKEFLLFYKIENLITGSKTNQAAVVETEAPLSLPNFYVSLVNLSIKNKVGGYTRWRARLNQNVATVCRTSDFEVDRIVHELFLSPVRGISLKTKRNDELLDKIARNRVWGNFYVFDSSIRNYERFADTRLDIIRLRDGERIVSGLPLTECAKSKIRNPNSWIGGANGVIGSFGNVDHIAAPLFDFDFPNLGILEFEPNEMVRIEIRVPAIIGEPELFYSETVPILIPLRLEDTYVYNRANGDSTDSYDNNQFGIFRTGGDKWVAIGFEQPIRDIIRLSYPNGKIWKVNDASLLNGANFGHGSTHDMGIDIDFPFGCALPGAAAGTCSASSIGETVSEVWDLFNTAPLHMISDFYLTVPNKAYTDARRAVLGLLENRCARNSKTTGNLISSRLVSFGLGKRPGWARSLVRDVEAHSSHIHLRMNLMTNQRTPLIRTRQPSPLLRNDFLRRLSFSIVNNRLVVGFSQSATAAERGMIYTWRVQDVSGYGQDISSLCTGYIFNGASFDSTDLSGFNCNGIRWDGTQEIYLSLMIASPDDGQCLQHLNNGSEFIRLVFENGKVKVAQ